MPATLTYVKGDATYPQLAEGEVGVLCHCCNDEGGWGSGFVLALDHRWSAPKAAYKAWHAREVTAQFVNLDRPRGPMVHFGLGSVHYVQVETNLWVANIIGQHKTIRTGSVRPVRYVALQEGLKDVAKTCQALGAAAHMPRLGSGLAGGEWGRIEQIIKDTLVAQGVSATVYDLV